MKLATYVPWDPKVDIADGRNRSTTTLTNTRPPPEWFNIFQTAEAKSTRFADKKSRSTYCKIR